MQLGAQESLGPGTRDPQPIIRGGPDPSHLTPSSHQPESRTDRHSSSSCVWNAGVSVETRPARATETVYRKPVSASP